MSILKILTDLFAIRQKIRLKNTFANIIFNVLVAKEPWKKIKMFI